MTFEALLLSGAAAAGGLGFRKLAGLVAQRTGHSRERAERAVGTVGVSLIASPRDDQREHTAPPTAPA